MKMQCSAVGNGKGTAEYCLKFTVEYISWFAGVGGRKVGGRGLEAYP